jgi:hypothetical protein
MNTKGRSFSICDANTISYLIAKGSRVLAIDHKGYHFQESDRALVQDYHNGGAVTAKEFAAASSEVFRVIKTLRAKNRMVREILKPDASLAVLCGNGPETSSPASL